MFSTKSAMVTDKTALPGRTAPLVTSPVVTGQVHFLSTRRLSAPLPDGLQQSVFAMGCFWGAERLFWQVPGVWLTMVGYSGGFTQNPTYEEVCSGRTGHAEVVRLIHDPKQIPYDALLRLFWEGHDPTQGMAQGNDRGTQYRSAIYTGTPEQARQAEVSRRGYNARLRAVGLGVITTEIRSAGPVYLAEDYHQQYLAKNPGGYCGLGGTGVSCPIGVTGG